MIYDLAFYCSLFAKKKPISHFRILFLLCAENIYTFFRIVKGGYILIFTHFLAFRFLISVPLFTYRNKKRLQKSETATEND